jgi:23S rRNA-intervening sequence protein
LEELPTRVRNRGARTPSNFASPPRLRRKSARRYFACVVHMQKILSYRDLEAWQLGMAFVERFGLTSQLRRAAVSIPSLVAEGHRQGTRAYQDYVVRALGSHAECETVGACTPLGFGGRPAH